MLRLFVIVRGLREHAARLECIVFPNTRVERVVSRAFVKALRLASLDSHVSDYSTHAELRSFFVSFLYVDPRSVMLCPKRDYKNP